MRTFASESYVDREVDWDVFEQKIHALIRSMRSTCVQRNVSPTSIDKMQIELGSPHDDRSRFINVSFTIPV
jgi:hypothetical protein